MATSRRTFMNLALVGGAVSAEAALKPVAAEMHEAFGSISILSNGTIERDFRPFLEILRRLMNDELRSTGAPGMTLALSSPTGFSAVVTAGYADLASRRPVQPNDLFEIGSVSKSLVAMCAFMLAQTHSLDLDGQVADVAPDLLLPPGQITVAQLLNHSSGLPANAPFFPRPTNGQLWSGFPPGSRFSYSNTGYDILAQVIARAVGIPFPAALRRLVLDPLGMASTLPAILNRDRSAVVTSYVPLQPDRPYRAGSPIAPAPWVEIDIGAGSIGAIPADMAKYLTFLGALLTNAPTPLHDPMMIERFLTPTISSPDFGEGARYANGLATVPINGRSCLYHSGGTFSFSSALVVDRDSGAGCFVSANIGGTPYRPKAMASYAAQALRTFEAGAPLPSRGVSTAAQPVPESDLVGHFISREMGALDVSIRDQALWVTFGGVSGRLQPLGTRMFAADHPDLAIHAFSFEPSLKKPDRLLWGEMAFGRGEALAVAPVPPGLIGLAGRYRNNDPWWDPASLIVREGKLLLEGSGELKPHPDGSWRFSDPALATERVWIDGRVNGRTTRLNISGVEFTRLDAYDS